MEDIIKVIFRSKMMLDLNEGIEDFLDDIDDIEDEDYAMFAEMAENFE